MGNDHILTLSLLTKKGPNWHAKTYSLKLTNLAMAISGDRPILQPLPLGLRLTKSEDPVLLVGPKTLANIKM